MNEFLLEICIGFTVWVGVNAFAYWKLRGRMEQLENDLDIIMSKTLYEKRKRS